MFTCETRSGETAFFMNDTSCGLCKASTPAMRPSSHAVSPSYIKAQSPSWICSQHIEELRDYYIWGLNQEGQ